MQIYRIGVAHTTTNIYIMNPVVATIMVFHPIQCMHDQTAALFDILKII